MTSLSGSFLIISEKILASMATLPLSKISPLMIVSIPSSISFPVNFISPADASIRIHSSIVIVVLDGIALRTVLTPDKSSDLLQIIFIV